MSGQANNIRSAFDPAEYDKKIVQTLPYYQDFYREIINLLKVYKNDDLSWMDVGCGTGKMAEAAFSGFKEICICRFFPSNDRNSKGTVQRNKIRI